MPYPNRLATLAGVSLVTVAAWSKKDLASCTVAELKAILAHINNGVYKMTCPKNTGEAAEIKRKESRPLRRSSEPQSGRFQRWSVFGSGVQ